MDIGGGCLQFSIGLALRIARAAGTTGCERKGGDSNGRHHRQSDSGPGEENVSCHAARADQKHLPFVLDGLRAFGLTDKPMVLMALATIRAETEGFVPIPEGRGSANTKVKPFDKYEPGTRVGKETRQHPARRRRAVQGPPRFVQLTGRDNYARVGTQMHADLVGSPDLGIEPATAGKILGQFLKNNESGIRNALAANDLKTARKLVNGGSNGSRIHGMRSGARGQGHPFGLIWRMILSANRLPPRIKSGAGFRRNMRRRAWHERPTGRQPAPPALTGERRRPGQVARREARVAGSKGVEPAHADTGRADRGGDALVLAPVSSSRAQQKMTRPGRNTRTVPKASDVCATCNLFEPPRSCKIVGKATCLPKAGAMRSISRIEARGLCRSVSPWPSIVSAGAVKRVSSAAPEPTGHPDGRYVLGFGGAAGGGGGSGGGGGGFTKGV